MTIGSKYGRGSLAVTFPDDHRVDVISPTHVAGVREPERRIGEALADPIGTPPLAELLDPSTRVAIVVSDATRATPNRLILPPILETLHGAGIPSSGVTIVNATGTHRENTTDELDELLSPEIARRYRIVQNRCHETDEFACVGTTTSGNRVSLNRAILDSDLRILTGYIEPHFFAGFSGGGKAIMPGCAGLDTILANHGAANIDHPSSTWGELERNPIAREVREAAAMAGPSFLVNVTMNRLREITGVFAGDPVAAHREGCAFASQSAVRPVDRLYDLVVTSNAGFPLDRNLYQAVKGMSAAERIVRPGGSILIVAECRDGIPAEGNFGRMLASTPRPEELLASIRTGAVRDQDSWQAQILCRIARKARLLLFSDRLTDSEIIAAHCLPARDPDRLVAQILASAGAGSSACVLPEGPETIPVFSARS